MTVRIKTNGDTFKKSHVILQLVVLNNKLLIAILCASIFLMLSKHDAFAQTYEIDAVNGQTITTCSGTFYDSGGAGGNYQLNENYSVTFSSANGQPITVDFLSWDVENNATCAWDGLRIYNGTNNSAPLIGTFCSFSPGSQTSSNAANSLHFEFYSDNIITESGWEATISCADPPVDPCTDPLGMDSDSDNVNDVCDLDNDNDGILNSIECVIDDDASMTPGVVPEAFQLTNAAGDLYIVGNNTNAQGYIESGFNDLMIANGVSLIYAGNLNTTFPNGTFTVTDDSSIQPEITATSTTDVTFISGSTGTGIAIVPPSADIEADDNVSYSAFFNFTTPVHAVSFDIVDVFDHNITFNETIDQFFNDTLRIFADGVLFGYLHGDATGYVAGSTGPVNLFDPNDNLIGTVGAGHDIEISLGFIFNPYDPVSQIELRTNSEWPSTNISTNIGAEDVHGYDELYYTTSSLCNDTDLDGIPDYLDLDSDGDGCSDANEAYADITADGGDGGVYGVGTPIIDPLDGTVTIASYVTPATTSGGQYTFQEGTTVAMSLSPSNQQVCEDMNAVFSAAATVTVLTTDPVTSASTDVTYQWQISVDGGTSFTDILGETGTVTSGTNVFLTLSNVTPSMNGYIYKVIFTNEANICGIEAQASLSVQAALDPGLNGSITICESESLTTDDLFNALGGTPDAGGTWTPAIFSGAGTYTYTHPATGVCPAISAEVIVTTQVCDVTGHIYEDTNGNGVQDAGEPDLPGIDVVITDSNGDTQTVTTDSNGNWIASVPAGNTTSDIVDSTLPAGSTQTEGTDPTTTTAVAGATTPSDNDGFFVPATVTGHVYLDTNGDGVQDPLGADGIAGTADDEPDLSGVDVVITDSNGDTQTVTTDANGNWTVEVPPGPTTADVIESTLPDGVIQTEGEDPTVVTAEANNTIDGGTDGYRKDVELTPLFVIDDSTFNNGQEQDAIYSIENIGTATSAEGMQFLITKTLASSFEFTIDETATTANVLGFSVPVSNASFRLPRPWRFHLVNYEKWVDA